MNKVLKLTLISIPLLVGGFLVYRVLTKDKREAKKRLQEGGGQTPQSSGSIPSFTPSQGDGGQSTPKPDFPIGLGSRGAKVKELQQAIVDDGQPTIVAMLGKNPTDGQFGTGTQKAVNELIKKTTIDSQADIDKIKGLKAQREGSAAQQTKLQERKNLANKLISIQKSNKRDFIALKSTTGFGGKVTSDGRFVQTHQAAWSAGQNLLKTNSFSVNKFSKNFNAATTVNGDIRANDENYYMIFSPYDTDVK